MTTEYRVVWRRSGWKAKETRCGDSRAAHLELILRMTPHWYDILIPPLKYAYIESRQASDWKKVEGYEICPT